MADGGRCNAQPTARRSSGSLAEETREVRDRYREELENLRQDHERPREAAEDARIATEGARQAAEEARHAAIEAVAVTADSLHSSLEEQKRKWRSGSSYHLELSAPLKLLMQPIWMVPFFWLPDATPGPEVSILF